MLNKLLENVEHFVTQSHRIMDVVDSVLNKLVPQNIAVAGGCSCHWCSPNCTTQTGKYFWIEGVAICKCVESGAPCLPC